MLNTERQNCGVIIRKIHQSGRVQHWDERDNSTNSNLQSGKFVARAEYKRATIPIDRTIS